MAIRMTLMDFLALHGQTGKQALDASTGPWLVKEDVYDVVSFDKGASDIDDDEIITTLRLAAPEPAHYCIALTCHGSQADLVRAAAAGFDHYLIKPGDTGILSRLL
jgi:DNA-binding response OmpR family regulator